MVEYDASLGVPGRNWRRSSALIPRRPSHSNLGRSDEVRCENCKAMAPSMKEVEDQFKNQVNFVVVDGSAEKNYELVRSLGVIFLFSPGFTAGLVFKRGASLVW